MQHSNLSSINVGERLYTSHGVYLRMVSITVFAVHSKAIIRGWLL